MIVTGKNWNELLADVMSMYLISEQSLRPVNEPQLLATSLFKPLRILLKKTLAHPLDMNNDDDLADDIDDDDLLLTLSPKNIITKMNERTIRLHVSAPPITNLLTVVACQPITVYI